MDRSALSKKNTGALTLVLLCGFLLFPLFSPASSAEEAYVFERMFPNLNPNWYFYRPLGVAIDDSGFVYIAEAQGNRVVKLNSAGRLVTQWGAEGNEDGQFQYPQSINIDRNGLVYVSDSLNDRIQWFDEDGCFVGKFGEYGTGPGQFSRPAGIAFDSEGNIYVVDSGNHRIQKFDENWQYITEWGSEGSEDGQFLIPAFIAIDSKDNVYVGERDSYPNYAVQKFTSDGQFLSKMDPDSSVYEQNQDFDWHAAIALDREDNLYVTWNLHDQIVKYNPDGQLLGSYSGFPAGGEIAWHDGAVYIGGYSGVSKATEDGKLLEWWSTGALNEHDLKFYRPKGLSVDGYGNTFLADFVRILKLSPDGEFLAKPYAAALDSDIPYPQDVDIGSDGNLYVLVNEFYNNHQVQVRDLDGNLITYWPIDTTTYEYRGLVLDSADNVYLTDRFLHRVLKYDKDGNFIKAWGGSGSGAGQFLNPSGVAIDANEDLYIVDTGNDRIQKFTKDGGLLSIWGSSGAAIGQFDRPQAVEVDADGNVFVADAGNSRIQKFSADGTFLIAFGGYGTGPGQMRDPMGITVDSSSGKVYVADYGNNRVQVFKKVALSTDKAVIVAGGGPYPGNNLWAATQICANHGYRALTYQGFSKDSIFYLSSDTDIDLDYNGLADDVDEDVTRAHLEQAITAWASDAENLVVYLVDHGGEGTFRLSGTETVSGETLDAWLDQVQAQIPGKVIVVVDACNSGSFVSHLDPPDGKERISIASAASGESAYFVSQGDVSFSFYFWTQIFSGLSIKDAFDISSSSISTTVSYQHPLLDDNGNGIGNEAEDGLLAQGTFIGSGTVVSEDAPVIGAVAPAQTVSGSNSALLYAENVTAAPGVSRVWATVLPPNFSQGTSYNPVNELPYVDFSPVGGDRWEAAWDGFTAAGTYQVTVYARDRNGNASVPQVTTVTVDNPLRHKAVIVAGSWPEDRLWAAAEKSAQLAYQALRFQGYADEDIYLMSPAAVGGIAADGPATAANLSDVLTTWAADSAIDLSLYMVGNGTGSGFRINADEMVTAAQIDALLDPLEATLSGGITVVYDACRAGSFLSSLVPTEGSQRVVIASTGADQPAYFLGDGDISFSSFFWAQIVNGATLYDAFVQAKRALWFLCRGGQTATIDDNGNGVGNEKVDGGVARFATLGTRILMAGDAPVIGSVSADRVLSGETTASIWAQDVTSTGTLARVWAVIDPPSRGQVPADVAVTDLPMVDLVYNAANNRWEGSYEAFDHYGTYIVSFYAMDTEGNLSIPAASQVVQSAGPDVFETDDAPFLANAVTLNAVDAQRHNFHDAGEEDWVKFYGIAEEVYEITTSNVDYGADTVIVVYDTDGQTPLTNPFEGDRTGDAYGYGKGEMISWTCPADGVYYVMVRQYDENDYGIDTGYDLRIYNPVGGTPGLLIGQVFDAAGNGIEGALLRVTVYEGTDQENTITAISTEDGYYLMVLPTGTHTVSVEMPGSAAADQQEVTITTENHAALDLTLDVVFTGDVNGDGKVDIADSILTLQTLSGLETAGSIRSDYGASGADTSGDGAAGSEEVIYVLQKISGQR